MYVLGLGSEELQRTVVVFLLLSALSDIKSKNSRFHNLKNFHKETR